MEKEFIPYEQALALKQLGFDEPCFATYFGLGAWQIDCTEGRLNLKNNKSSEYSILAPIFSQSFRWFREKHGLLHDITLGVNNDNELESFYILIHKLNGLVINEDDDIELSVETTNKEEAELACLNKLIEIVK